MRKFLASLLIFSLTAQSSFALSFSGEIIPTASTTINEAKVQAMGQYLFQNRDNSISSTIIDGQNKNILELDSTSLYNLAKLKTQSIIKGTTSSQNIGEAKALYDGNIAIVEMANPQTGRKTYETPYFCDLLISSLAKFAKIGGNICLPDYATFNNSYTQNSTRSYVTVIKTSELATADLSRFGIVIFPDIVLWSQSEILDSIGATGINNLTTYTKNGGITFFSAKSILLAQKMRLVAGVDENTLIKHRFNNGVIETGSGDFISNVMNLGLYSGKDYPSSSGSTLYDFVAGSYLVHPEEDSTIVPVRYFAKEKDSGYYFQDIPSSEELDGDNAPLVASFYKPYEKGMVLYNGGNSLFSSQNASHILYTNHVSNAILLSFLRDIYAHAQVKQTSNPLLQPNIIPALEKDILFNYSLDATNVFSSTDKNLSATIQIATGAIVEGDLPSECSGSGTRTITCNKNTLESGTNWNISFALRVLEPTLTQAKTNIGITTTTLNYTNSKNMSVSQPLGAQNVNALESANMSSALNIDPSGYYPLLGEGIYTDQVLDTQNKGASEASAVEYSTIVPLISPLFDEYDQKTLVHRLKLDTSYYEKTRNEATKTNLYPMTDSGACHPTNFVLADRCKDFLIPKLFSENTTIVDNYDEPTSRQKTDDLDASNNISATSSGLELGGNILKQSFLPDASTLFLHASPRKMPFVSGAKKELLFARQDVYFYNNPALPLPKGIASTNDVITIDASDNCSKTEGAYAYPEGVKAAKYPNKLKCDSTKTKKTWDNLPSGIEQSSYLYPIDPSNNISSVSDVVGFDADGNYTGNTDDFGEKSSAYPVKLIKGDYGEAFLPPRSSTKGGYIEVPLTDGISADDVYAFADHVAIDHIEKNSDNVKIYFYRGKQANEQSLKSNFGIALLGSHSDVVLPVKIYSLSYNLSDANNKQSYTLERSLSLHFTDRAFLQLPAVKLSFSLPRRKTTTLDVLAPLALSDGQKAILFTTSEYYSSVLAFKATTQGALNSNMASAKLSTDQKTQLSAMFSGQPLESYVRKYENMEPMVRFGTYIQELAFHRTVYGPIEDHPIHDPGIMADKPLFGNIGNAGTSPVPYREYLTTGSSQIIPMIKESSAIKYKDIFGRSFSSPFRSTVPEAAPLPPPLRNFVMNTTYEMYDKDGNAKTQWDGETPLEVRQNVKVFNNYAKYFDATRCADNADSVMAYGKCYDGSGSQTTGWNGENTYKLADKNLDDNDFFWTKNIRLFESRAAYNQFVDQLNAALTASGITNYTVPTLHKAVNGQDSVHLAVGEKIDDKAHNYSPEVERYYPAGYIEPSMWNLTHWDYNDDVYAKGYPYHLDNLLPNPASNINLPHNIISIPTFKGLGYALTYFSDSLGYSQYESQNSGKIENNIHPYSSWKYSGKTGWWPENLQNRDKTLLAGQQSVQSVPYDARNTDYLTPSSINETSFDAVDKGQINNIYSCLFNPRTLKNNSATQLTYKPNVNLNNVIPLIPWIQKENENSDYLSHYNCIGNAYIDSNLYKINNLVETEDAFWSYFAANLRGEAKEGLNIVNRLNPLASATQKYEGDVKVVQGGRFVYWNPGLGLNAYQISDSPVSIIKSVSSSIKVDKELLPYTLKNTSSDAYLLYTVSDPGEISIDSKGKETPRQWKEETYTDSWGGGNYGSNIYVGASYNGAAKKSLLTAGDSTLVQINLNNNSGYDWEMTGSGQVANDNGQFVTHISGGIDFDIAGNQPFNANDLLYKLTRNVLKPKAYNFLSFDVPEELKPYITITPSDANTLTPGTFFDFDFVNVTTIRDGFKGSYFVNVAISPSLPDNLKGKVYDIKAKLNSDYFAHFPASDGKDPAHWNKYPQIPNLRLALANTDGEAYYISGTSSGVTLDISYASGFTFDKAYELTSTGLDSLRLAAGDGTNKHQRLRETFSSLEVSGGTIRPFSGSVVDSNDESTLHFDFAQNGIASFPYVRDNTIIPKTYVLVHLTKPTLSDGEHIIENSDNISYVDANQKPKVSANSTPLKGYAQGPKLDIRYTYSLLDGNSKAPLAIQKLAANTQNTIKLNVYLKNTGTDIAFNPSIGINVDPQIAIDTSSLSGAALNDGKITIHNLYSESGAQGVEGEAIGPGITSYFPLYLSYSGAYQNDPISLINQASYVFTPYDPILPAQSGSYSTGFALDFIKTNLESQKIGVDTLAISGSGNSDGLLWDITTDNQEQFTKQTADANFAIAKNVALDPTQPHSLLARAFVSTTGSGFYQVANFAQAIDAAPITLDKTTNSIARPNATTLALNYTTNKLGKWGGSYSGTLDNDTTITGSLSDTTNNTLTFSGIDLLTLHTVNLQVFSGSETIGTLNWDIPADSAKISNTYAIRNGSGITLQFKTNALYGAKYLLTSDSGSQSWSGYVQNERTTLLDTTSDVFADHLYTLSLTKNKEVIASGNLLYTAAADTSNVPTRLFAGSGSASDLTFDRTKDFGINVKMEDTLVRYAARLKFSGSGFTQKSNDGTLEVRYNSGQLVYAADAWDKKINTPQADSGATLSGYTTLSSLHVGSSVPLVFDRYNTVVFHQVWEKPDRVVLTHGNTSSDIVECPVATSLNAMSCWYYDTDTLYISSKKMSSYTLYKKNIVPPTPAPTPVSNGSSSGGGGGLAIVRDICPEGDYSASYYDNSCGIKPKTVVIATNKEAKTTPTTTDTPSKTNKQKHGLTNYFLLALLPDNKGKFSESQKEKIINIYAKPLLKKATTATSKHTLLLQLKQKKTLLRSLKEKQVMQVIIQAVLDALAK